MVTILFVDDDPLMHRMLVPRLQDLKADGGPCRVVSAHTPEEALDALQKLPEDDLVVLTDFNLKAATNGFQLLQRVRVERPRALRILLSGYSVEQLGDLARGGDTDAFLEKPLLLDELLAPLQALIAKRVPAS